MGFAFFANSLDYLIAGALIVVPLFILSRLLRVRRQAPRRVTSLDPSEGLVRPFAVTHRGVLAIAIPMTLAYLTTPLVGVVNLGVIGQLGDPALVGGVSIGALVFDFVFVTFNFLRSGTTGLVAQAFGADDRREVAATFFRALIVAAVVGVAVLLLKRHPRGRARALSAAATRCRRRPPTIGTCACLATPFALANYVVLGWLIGLGRAGYGLLLQTRAERHQHRPQRRACACASALASPASAGRAFVAETATPVSAGGRRSA